VKMPLKSGRGKRAPFTDSSYQLALLGVRPIQKSPGEFFANVYEGEHKGEHWRIERVQDPDYPWLMTRKADGATRKCSSLVECVNIVTEPDEGWGFELCKLI
jgi:hypothetical protein